MSDQFVATDADGLQHHEGYRRRWPLPVRGETGWQPGDVVEADEHGAAVFSTGASFSTSSENASSWPNRPAKPARPASSPARRGPRSRQRRSRSIVSSTSWRSSQAALTQSCPTAGRSGRSSPRLRQYLETGTGSDDHRLGFVSRIAAARRLRRESTAIGDAAFTAAAQAEGQGVDIWSDPAWGTLAAARDAVLAAVEAVRHVAFPFLVDRETRRYEAHEEHKVAEVDQVDTPWGRFAVGGAGPKYAPSWVAARDAAERSRQAATDLNGPTVGQAERTWQIARLEERLGTE